MKMAEFLTFALDSTSPEYKLLKSFGPYLRIIRVCNFLILSKDTKTSKTDYKINSAYILIYISFIMRDSALVNVSLNYPTAKTEENEILFHYNVRTVLKLQHLSHVM